jgi:hypothetical protein
LAADRTSDVDTATSSGTSDTTTSDDTTDDPTTDESNDTTAGAVVVATRALEGTVAEVAGATGSAERTAFEVAVRRTIIFIPPHPPPTCLFGADNHE